MTSWQRAKKFLWGIVAIYFFLQLSASRLGQPALTLPDPTTRERFPVDFAFPTLSGEELRLSSLRGKAVLVSLWATWCAPCRAELPSMQALYADYQSRGLVILGIAMDPGGQEVVAPFVQEYKVNFPVLLDAHNTLGARLQVPGIPTSYVLDQAGQIVSMEMGARDWNTPKVRHFFDQLLAETASISSALVDKK